MWSVVADFPVRFGRESPASLNLSGSVEGGEDGFTESASVTTLLGALWFLSLSLWLSQLVLGLGGYLCVVCWFLM